MEFRNLTPFDALCFSALGVDDQEYPVLVMKVGYRLLSIDGHTGQFRAEVLDDDPLPLCTGDTYYGEEGSSSVCEESDLAPFKPRCDVIVVGNAYAPQGQPTTHWTAGLRISAPVPPLPPVDVPLPTPLSPGERLTEYQLAAWQAARQEAARRRANAPTRHYLLDKYLNFTGPRHFRHSLFGGWQLTEPQPATSVPLRWEYAFGGSSMVLNPEHAVDANTPPYLLNEVCYSNPLGRGWIEKREEDLGYQLDQPLRELPAPQIEPIDKPVWRLERAKHPEGELNANGMAQIAANYKNQPAGFGILGRAWAPRLPLAGSYDEAWQRERWPGLPTDSDFGYWNGAPADQQIEFPPPAFRLELLNLTDPALTPDGTLCVELPGHRAFVLMRLRNGAMLPLPMLTDTLRIDTEAMTLALTHRISLPNDLDIRVLEARFETDPNAPLIKRAAREAL
ncbi:DUF2169 domain-containing protein [Pseudomonas sp. MUP55]|uniref:DUF2169 family type VI secretion system accessory protein n=1 Tax=Pseudomonas sp. MUP55 TaxID=3087234 RepID=UPI002A5A7A13|nr:MULTISPECIES: DUF2169 domain-containing protein [unclassified Pseudomonas]WPN94688.1 DUF2169 domain-containing protein [Pseudomonas sp. MUP56]WPO00215.1 DUF2169 domain-containing protein [Pseudomonas sp. MUP55]